MTSSTATHWFRCAKPRWPAAPRASATAFRAWVCWMSTPRALSRPRSSLAAGLGSSVGQAVKGSRRLRCGAVRCGAVKMLSRAARKAKSARLCHASRAGARSAHADTRQLAFAAKVAGIGSFRQGGGSGEAVSTGICRDDTGMSRRLAEPSSAVGCGFLRRLRPLLRRLARAPCAL